MLGKMLGKMLGRLIANLGTHLGIIPLGQGLKDMPTCAITSLATFATNSIATINEKVLGLAE